MSRMKFVTGSLLGAAAIHIAFLACSGPRRETGDSGSALDVVTDAVTDAMRAVVDGEVRDAAAQDSGSGPVAMRGTCAATAPVNGATYYFASFDVPGFDPATGPDVSARTCEFLCTTPPCGVRGDVFGVVGTECRTESSVWMRRGRIDVFCGTEGNRAQTARVWVR